MHRLTPRMNVNIQSVCAEGWRSLWGRWTGGDTMYTGGYTAVHCRFGAVFFLIFHCQSKHPQLYSARSTYTELKDGEKNISISSWVTVGMRTSSFSLASSCPDILKCQATVHIAALFPTMSASKQGKITCLLHKRNNSITCSFKMSNTWPQSWSNGTTLGQEL